MFSCSAKLVINSQFATLIVDYIKIAAEFFCSTAVFRGYAMMRLFHAEVSEDSLNLSFCVDHSLFIFVG